MLTVQREAAVLSILGNGDVIKQPASPGSVVVRRRSQRRDALNGLPCEFSGKCFLLPCKFSCPERTARHRALNTYGLCK